MYFVTKISSPEWWQFLWSVLKKFKVLKLISSNIELGLCWICDAAHVLEFLDIQEFLTNRNNTNNTSDFYQICQSHIRSLFWVFLQYLSSENSKRVYREIAGYQSIEFSILILLEKFYPKGIKSQISQCERPDSKFMSNVDGPQVPTFLKTNGP